MRKPLLSALLLSCVVLGLLSLVPGYNVHEAGFVSGDTAEKIDQYLERITPFGFAGALLVAKDGEIILNKGYGLAIRKDNVFNSKDTVFSTGSITKQFTAAGIMKLEMSGRLDTSDTITKFFQSVPEDKKSITLHHLLTHTSGVVDMVGGDYEKAERDETVRKILARPLQFEPGEEFAYSNGGYSILAAVIEMVSGEPYEKFMFKNLFEPAGMFFTGYRRPDWTERTVAHWYVENKDNGTPLGKNYPYWNLLGNGGILSTTSDMYRWHLALLDEGILSSKVKRKMFTPVLNEYGYGWDILDTDRGILIQHDGGSMLGNSAEFRRYIDARAVSILFCNQAFEGRPLFDAVRDRIEVLIFDGDVPVPPKVKGNTDNEISEEMTGLFEMKGGGSLQIREEDGRLLVRGTDRRTEALLFGADPDDLDTYERLNEISETIFSEALEGNFEPFFENMANREDRAGPVKDLIRERLEMSRPRTGDIEEVKALRTIPEFFRGKKTAFTSVELKGREGSLFFGLIWEGDKNIGVRTMMAPSSVRIPFLPVTDMEFAGYHLAAGKVLTLHFVRKNERIAGILLSSGAGEISAGKKN